MLACACCANSEPNTAEQEGEQQDEQQTEEQGIFGGAFSALNDLVEDVQETVENALETVQDAVEDAVDAVRDSVVDGLGLDEKFKSVADNTLDDIAPKAGDMVVADAVSFIPYFQKFDDNTPRDIDGEAKEACSSTILGFREKIHDFCEDVIEFLKETSDMIAGALKCLYKVVSWILRACKEGVQCAVELVKKVIPDCCEPMCLGCMGLGAKLVEFVTTTFNKLIDMVEEFIQAALRAVGVPEWICEKIDFNGNAHSDNATDDDEPVKKKKQREAAEAGAGAEEAPEQEQMDGEGAEPEGEGAEPQREGAEPEGEGAAPAGEEAAQPDAL